MGLAIRFLATIGLLVAPVSAGWARDANEQEIAQDTIEQPDEPEDQAKPNSREIPDLEEFTPFEVSYAVTEIRPKIVAPAADPWQATLDELEPGEQRQFKRMFGKLSADDQAAFLEVSAWMRLGQRGLLVDLLLRSNRTEQAATFAFFAHLSSERRRIMAGFFDWNYGKQGQEIWKTLPPYLALASPREAEIVIFGPALNAACGMSPIEEENVASVIEAEAVPYDAECHARVKVLSGSWVYTGTRMRGARFRTATTLTAPWQGALHRYGQSATLANDPLAVRKEWQELKVTRKDWEREHICGAVYIGGPWMLIAAHCVLPQPPGGFLANRVIRLGSIFLSQDAQEIPIVAAVHNNYRQDLSNRDDIALLRLAHEPRVGSMASGGAQRVNLPARGAARPGSGEDLIATGWGWREVANDNRTVLAPGRIQRTQDALGYGTFQRWDGRTCAENPVVKDMVARKLWTIHPGQFCAGSRDRQDSCRGDSGGPMVWKRPGGAVLVGLVSYGKGCGVEGAPGIYTDVQYYVDNGWIERAKARARPGEFVRLP
jgi:hypothetical protein